MTLYLVVRVDLRFAVNSDMVEKLLDGNCYNASIYTGKAYKRESMAKRALAMAVLHGPKNGVAYQIVEIKS